MTSNVNSDFVDFIQSFEDSMVELFSPVTNFLKKKSVKKSTKQFTNLLVNEISKKDIQKIIENDILKNMPEGIWNIDTIGIVEKKMELFISEDILLQFMNQCKLMGLNEQEKIVFLKNFVVPQLKTLKSCLSFQNKYIKLAAFKEKEPSNITFANQIVRVNELIVNQSTDLLEWCKNDKKFMSKDFKIKFKKFWTVFTLLNLRVFDLVLKINQRKEFKQKLNYLDYELIKARKFYSNGD